MCQHAQTVEQIFEMLLLKFLAKLKKFHVATVSTVFLRFLRNLAQIIYVSILKNWNRFLKVLLLKFLAIF